MVMDGFRQMEFREFFLLLPSEMACWPLNTFKKSLAILVILNESKMVMFRTGILN
jgi:hypothetical protein